MCGDKENHDHATSALEAEGREEPPVLAGEVTLLERLLDLLLGVLPRRNLLEGLGGDDTLERLELESVTGREEVVVVDRLFCGSESVAEG